MNLLTEQQIKQYQLILLQTNGPSLAQYASKICKFSKSVSKDMNVFAKNKLNVVKSKSMGFSSNANIKAFIYILLNTIYAPNINQDILAVLKSTFYDSALSVILIKHNPFPELSNKQAKKLLVEFFYSLAYSSQKDKIQAKFSKYPIVLDILITYFRSILTKYNVKHANNFLFQLPTNQILSILVGYFDLNCKQSNSLFLFYQENLFVLQSQHQEILIGEYLQHEKSNHLVNNWQNHSIASSQSQFQFKREYIQDKISKKEEEISQVNDRIKNHKVLLKKIMFQSIVYEPESQQEAPTPFFSGNIPSFNPKGSQLRKSRENFSLDSKKPYAFGQKVNHISLFKPIQENQINQSDYGKDSMIKRSQNIQVQLQKRFSQRRQQNQNNVNQNFLIPGPQKSQTLKSLKKSKSQSSLQKKLNENDEQLQLSNNSNRQHIKRSSIINNRQKKKNYSEYYPKSNNNSQSNLSQKKKSVQYVSNLYSINIENISKDHHKVSLNDLQRKKALSIYSIKSNQSQHIYSMPQRSFIKNCSFRNESSQKNYNPQQRSTKEKQENMIKQAQGIPKKVIMNRDVFKKQKIFNEYNDLHKKNNSYMIEQNGCSNFLSDCPLSPISNNQSLSSNAIQKDIFGKPKLISFTYINSLGKKSGQH